MFVDHTVSSNNAAGIPSLDLTELREFLSFLQRAFGADIKFIQGQSSDAALSSQLSQANYLDLMSLAIAAANGDYLVFLESDNIIQPAFLSSIFRTFDMYPEVFVLKNLPNTHTTQ